MIKRIDSKTNSINILLKAVEEITNSNKENFDEYLDEDTGKKIMHGTGNLLKEKAEPKINIVLEKIRKASLDKFVNIKNRNKKAINYKVIEVKPEYYPGGCSILFYCKKVNKNMTIDSVLRKFLLYYIPHEFITEKELLRNLKKKWTSDFSIVDKKLYILKNEVGRIKIGQAINVDNRLKTILAQSGISVEVLRVVENGAIYERHLLKLFKDKNYHCEWFNLNEDDVNFLLNTNFTEYFKDYR
jgi:hypothetical protein